jgi:hypothetical protein
MRGYSARSRRRSAGSVVKTTPLPTSAACAAMMASRTTTGSVTTRGPERGSDWLASGRGVSPPRWRDPWPRARRGTRAMRPAFRHDRASRPERCRGRTRGIAARRYAGPARWPRLRATGSARKPLENGKKPPVSRGLLWSGRPYSKRRPSPWQGDALPAELRPQRGDYSNSLRVGKSLRAEVGGAAIAARRDRVVRQASARGPWPRHRHGRGSDRP